MTAAGVLALVLYWSSPEALSHPQGQGRPLPHPHLSAYAHPRVARVRMRARIVKKHQRVRAILARVCGDALAFDDELPLLIKTPLGRAVPQDRDTALGTALGMAQSA